MDPLVVAANLAKRYGAHRALDGLSFRIGPGAVGLLGPNGAGKTTLIRVLLGLTEPTEGTFSVMGLCPKERLAIRSRVGYSPEIEAQFPDMTALEAATYSGRLSGMPAGEAFRRAHEILHYVGLGEARYRKVETFSTGMKQRVKIAQALVHAPKFVILDEPTAGLDPAGRREILDLILDATRHRGIHILLSTHILHDVERVCSHVLLLHRGRLLRAGPLAEILQGATPQWELRFDGDEGGLAAALRGRGFGVEPVSAGALRIQAEGRMDTRLVLQSAVEAGCAVRHLGRASEHLDDVFLRLVR